MEGGGGEQMRMLASEYENAAFPLWACDINISDVGVYYK
jgi:hypothetical protein